MNTPSWSPALRLGLVLGGCAVGACGGAPGRAPAPEEAPGALEILGSSFPLRASVRFTHPSPDRWRAEYAFTRPVGAVGFRHPSLARSTWRVKEPADARIAGRYVLRAEPFDHLVLELGTEVDQPEKDYRAFYKYADRGTLVYTGQLAPFEATCAGSMCRSASDDEIPGRLVLVPAAGEAVTVQGRASATEAEVDLSPGGTFAYFGDLPVIEADGVVGVFDRGMPAWMSERLSRDLPRILGGFAARFGPLAAPAPTLFVTFAARAAGSSVGGSVLPPHVLTLDLELPPEMLTPNNPGTLREIDQLVAHEGAHFWNGDQFTFPDDPTAVWLHEGSADALALRALRSIEAIDEVGYRAALSEAASECALWLGGGQPLTAAVRPNHARAFYVCGSTLGLLSEAALRRQDPRADLLTLWRAVFDTALAYAQDHGQRPAYDEALYLHELRRLGGDDIADALRPLVHDPLADSAKALRDALASVGIPTRETANLPADYEARAAVSAVEGVLSSSCVAGLEFTGNVTARPRVARDGACDGLAKGEVIARLAGERIGPRGASAYRAAYAACVRRGVVEVVTERERHVQLACAPPSDLRSPPPFFTITHLP